MPAPRCCFLALGRTSGLCFNPGLTVRIERSHDLVHGTFDHRPFELALPDGQAVPSHGLELGLVQLVALLVASHLGLPELGIRLRMGIGAAAVMSVPEAAVYENAGPVLRQHYVRRARKAFYVDSEAETGRVQGLAHLQLRGSVLASDM